MAKFAALLKNEFIKSWSRITAKLMIPVIILITVAVVGICNYSNRVFLQELGYYFDSSDVDYSMRIRRSEEMKKPGYEFEIELYTFLQENNISFNGYDWRLLAAETVFSVDHYEGIKAIPVYPEAVRNEVLSVVKNGDWKEGCRILINMSKESEVPESEYWEFEYRLKNNYPFPETTEDALLWYNGLISRVRESGEGNSSVIGDDIKTALFQLDNHVRINTADFKSLISESDPFTGGFDIYSMMDSGVMNINIWSAMYTSMSLIVVICLFISIIACSSITSEYSSGTVKFLLINPVKRWKILMAKFFMCLITGLLMTIILFAVALLTSVIVFGSEDLRAPFICVENGEIVVKNSMMVLIRAYLLSSVKIIVITSFAFAMSTLITNGAASSAVTMFMVFGGSVIVSLLKQSLRQDWARYLFFANTDLENIIRGDSMFNGHTIGFAAAVLAVHTFVFLLIAWDAFTKKEI